MPRPNSAAERERQFDAFYSDHRDRIGQALVFTLGDHGLGFDAVDEAMARAFQRWTDVSSYSNPEGWVYRTGLNWARSFLRRRKRSRVKDIMLASPEASMADLPNTDLQEAMTHLSDDHRAVVVLRFFMDWSVEDTAAALQIAPGTVKSRSARAVEQLRGRLELKTRGDNVYQQTRQPGFAESGVFTSDAAAMGDSSGYFGEVSP